MNHFARAQSRASSDPVWTSFERLAQRGRHGIEHFLRILDAVPADAQRERSRALLEAPVAAADGAGADEPLALEAAVALEVRPPLRVAPVDHQPVAQTRPARQGELLLERP